MAWGKLKKQGSLSRIQKMRGGEGGYRYRLRFMQSPIVLVCVLFLEAT